MVHFYSGKTTVQLSIAELEQTTDRYASTGQSIRQTNAIKHTAHEFAKASLNGTLSETYILDPEDGLHTQFIGKQKNTPFFMVQAGKNLFSPTASERRNSKPARIPLYESINGSNRTFFEISDGGFKAAKANSDEQNMSKISQKTSSINCLC